MEVFNRKSKLFALTLVLALSSTGCSAEEEGESSDRLYLFIVEVGPPGDIESIFAGKKIEQEEVLEILASGGSVERGNHLLLAIDQRPETEQVYLDLYLPFDRWFMKHELEHAKLWINGEAVRSVNDRERDAAPMRIAEIANALNYFIPKIKKKKEQPQERVVEFIW